MECAGEVSGRLKDARTRAGINKHVSSRMISIITHSSYFWYAGPAYPPFYLLFD